jgi:hypothetical protein
MARACTAGKRAGAAMDGDTTATLSPGLSLGTVVNTGRMALI